jgi:very-short-patch-repair endonuclease
VDRPRDRVLRIAAFDAEAEQKLALLATEQHGVAARTQLLALGFTRNKIQRRIDEARLHRIHRGVYAVGHRKLTLKGIWLAAVLAVGADALVSHRAGLALWDLRRSESGLIDVTVPGSSGKPGPKGVRVHTTLSMCPHDVAVIDGIPVTSLAWTVIDYAGIADQRQVRLVLEALERRRIYIGRELDELLERTPNRKGARTTRAAIAEIAGPAPWHQSVLEETFHELIRASDLPDYEANVFVEGELVDALWRQERVIVELDGFAFHKSRAQFEADRRRDAKLTVAGYKVLRITQQRLQNEPEAVLDDLRALLSAARAAWAAAGR